MRPATVANRARAIADLNKQLSIEMLEARRNEKNFQQRRNESYAKAHAELMGPINRDFDEVERLMAAGGMSALSDKMKQAQDGFKRYAIRFQRARRGRDQARPERDARPVRLAPRRRARHRDEAEGDRRSADDELDADDAPAREGLHAAA